MNYGVCYADPGCVAAVLFVVVFFLLMGLLVTAVFLFKLFLWWRVFSKAGYSGAFGLLLLAPFGSLIMLCILAFSKWPIAKLPEQQA